MVWRKPSTASATVLILGWLATTPVSAQVITGTVEGTVTDASGAVLPGVSVTATNQNTGAVSNAVTTGTGLYRLTFLPPDSYNIKAEISGFQTSIQQGIQVSANETRTLNFKLELAKLSAEVTVQAETPLVTTAKGELTRTFDEKAILDTPTTVQVSGFAGRSVYSLATLAPGVTTPAGRFDRAFLGSGGSNVVANGMRARSTDFMLDGIDNTDPEDYDYRQPVTVEGVKELQVNLNAWSAELGRAGAAMVNAITKSGTNSLHGSAWEFYFNNAKFTSRASVSDPLKFAEFTLNLFGATLGGPIAKDKLFFFGMFEDNIRRGLNTAVATVPLPTERTPNSGSAAGDAIIRSWLDLYPLPNRTDINPRRYETNVPFNYDTPNPFIKLDYSVSDRTKFMARYDYRGQDFKITRVLKGNGGDIVDRAQSLGAQLTHTFSTNFLSEYRFGYGRRRIDLPVEKGFESFPTVTSSFSTLGPISVQFPIFRKLNDYTGNVTFSYVRSRHALKWGGEIRRTLNPGIQSDNVRGFISFGAAYGRTAIENFLAGTPSSYTVTIGPVARDFRNWQGNIFIQDDVKLNPNFTLNLGLRNELETVWKEKDNRTAYGYKNDFSNISPRLGFAWDVFGNGHTALRGGYGISYDHFNFFFLRSFQFQAPLTRTVTILPTDVPLTVVNLQGGVPSNTPTAVFQVDPGFKLPRVQTWNLTVERQLRAATTLRLSYTGSASRGAIAQVITNRAVPTPDATFGNRQARRPDPTLTTINTYANASDGDYHGLQVDLQRRFANNLQFQIAYTFAKSIDMTSDPGFQGGAIWVAQTESDRRGDLRGLSSYDQRHTFNANMSYTTPDLESWGKGVSCVLGRWTLALTISAHDGRTFNIVCGAFGGDCNIDGVSQDRPNVNDPSILHTTYKDKPVTAGDFSRIFIPRSAFNENVPPGDRGNLGRGAFRTAPQFFVNLGFVKNIRTVGRQSFQFRAEFFNVTNSTFAGQPVAGLASPDFGKILSVGGNRTWQFGFKYLW